MLIVDSGEDASRELFRMRDVVVEPGVCLCLCRADTV